MKTAVIMGSGPEIDFFFSLEPDKRGGVVPFSTTASDGHPQRHDPQLTVLNILDRRAGVPILKAAGISRIVTIGSIKIKGNSYARSLSSIGELPSLAISRLQGKDALRLAVFRKLRADFEFPLVRSVLSFLFAPNEVRVQPNADSTADDKLLDAVLKMDVPAATDPELLVNGQSVKIFRVPKDDAINLINRRLYLDKMKEAHRRGVTHFYFDLDRTIVVGLADMIAYANKYDITLRSFRES